MMRIQPTRPLPGALLWTLIALSQVAACSKPREASPEQGDRPYISEIVPDEGPAGVDYPIQVTIYGFGFDPTGNVVTFGDIEIDDLSSNGTGTMVVFPVPKQMPATGEVPPFVLQPGRYRITVTTAAGRSQAMTFTLTRGPSEIHP